MSKGYRRISKRTRRRYLELYKKAGGMSNCELARSFGVTEGTIRYWKKREGKQDLRTRKPSGVRDFDDQIGSWMTAQSERLRKECMLDLYETLRTHHGFSLSYDALRRYIKKQWPAWKDEKASTRIETPPGILTQVDWKEDVKLRLGSWDNVQEVQFFIAQLGFSRHMAVVPSLEKDMDAFLQAHNRAWVRLGGLTEWVRTDCLATAVKTWHGRSSELNATYERYLTTLGVRCFPSRPGTPTDKGKVEKRIRDFFSTLDIESRVFKDLQELQSYLDEKVVEYELSRHSAATGLPIAQSWYFEQKRLKPLPETLPVDARRMAWCKVRKDGTVSFGGNFYQVHHRYTGERVLCIHTGNEIRLELKGAVLGEWPHLERSRGMLRLSKEVMDDPSSRLSPLVKQWAQETSVRQIEYYQTITGEVSDGA